MILLQEKYNIEFKTYKNIFFRFYHGDENRYGYAFPLLTESSSCDEEKAYLKTALDYIIQEAKTQKKDAPLCLITQEQKKAIDETLAENFPKYKMQWKTNCNDCDYIYLRENLANLPGSNYQKKRNHVSRFNRTYGTDWKFKSFPQNDIADDILKVAETWFKEKNETDNRALELELQSIKYALENSEELKIQGGVLYVHDVPAAMTMGSEISQSVMDVIYEKSIAEYEKDGAYAVINQQFAKKCEGFLYFNREEDMGIEGMRKAKLSYKPSIILDKFYGKIVSV